MLCAATALAFLVVLILHAQQRQDLHLPDRPRSTIAEVGMLLSPSPFDSQFPRTPDEQERPLLAHRPSSSIFEVVRPGDTHKDIKAKLKDKKFRLGKEGTVEMVEV